MPGVTARKYEKFDSLLRRFKRSVEKADIMQEIRKREFHEKPSAIRKRNKQAAIKRFQRTQQPPDQFGSTDKHRHPHSKR